MINPWQILEKEMHGFESDFNKTYDFLNISENVVYSENLETAEFTEKSMFASGKEFVSIKMQNLEINIKNIVDGKFQIIGLGLLGFLNGQTDPHALLNGISVAFSVSLLSSISKDVLEKSVKILFELWDYNFSIEENSFVETLFEKNIVKDRNEFKKEIETLTRLKSIKILDGRLIPIEKLTFNAMQLNP